MDYCRGSPMARPRVVVCPKPRRAGPTNFNMPLRFHMRRNSNDADAFESKPGVELLLDQILLRTDGCEPERCASISSSPPFFFGSPPCRASNPLIQDADFGVQKPTPICSSPSNSASPPSGNAKVKFTKKQATVRVEGFDCRSSRAVAIA